MPEILGINHIAFAPKDPEKAAWFFQEVLGLNDGGSEVVKTQATETVFFDFPSLSTPTRLELLKHDSQSDSGPIQSFLEKLGAGWHHMSFAVASVRDMITHLKLHGVQLISDEPQAGAHNTQVVFVHPRSTGGVLVEFTQENSV